MLRWRDLEVASRQLARRDQPLGHPVGEHARADGVDAYAEPALLGRQPAHHRLDRGLGRRRQAVAHREARGGRGGHRDDASPCSRAAAGAPAWAIAKKPAGVGGELRRHLRRGRPGTGASSGRAARRRTRGVQPAVRRPRTCSTTPAGALGRPSGPAAYGRRGVLGRRGSGRSPRPSLRARPACRRSPGPAHRCRPRPARRRRGRRSRSRHARAPRSRPSASRWRRRAPRPLDPGLHVPVLVGRAHRTM